MSRHLRTVAVFAVAVGVALPAFAQNPAVSKRVLSVGDGSAVVIINVAAGDRAIYGITITDESASIEDVVSPKGWVGVTSGDYTAFATDAEPIQSGKSATFRIVTTNREADLHIVFRDAKSHFGEKKRI